MVIGSSHSRLVGLDDPLEQDLAGVDLLERDRERLARHRRDLGRDDPPEPLTEASRHRATAQSARPLQEMLALYGYRIGVTSCFDERTRIVVTAFQRHFRPARVDGIADRSTIVTLQNLLRERPKPPAPVSQFFSGYDEEPVE